MRNLFLAFALIAIGEGVMAQTDDCNIRLSGVVIDSLDQTPLNNTQIALVGVKNFEVVTDNDGKFIIDHLCPGDIELHISHLNCEHLHIHIELIKDTFIKLYIRHIDQEFEGARIITKRQNSDASDRVDKSRIENSRSAGISQIFAELGGVTLMRTGNSISKPVVNGLHSNRVIVINNGIRQEGQNWGMEHAPEIDPFLASEVALIRGAQSLRYGADGIGGVLLVNPASVFREKNGVLKGEFNLIGFTNGRGGIASIIAGYKVSDRVPLYFKMNATVKQAGNTRTPQYFLDNTGLNEQNFSFNVGYAKSKWRSEIFYSHFNSQIGLFTGSQIGNLSDLKIAMQRERPITSDQFSYSLGRPYQQARHQLYKWKTNWFKDPLNSFELVMSYQRNHREEYDVLRSASSSTTPAFDYSIGTWMADLIWTRLDVFGYKIQGGVFGLHQSNAYEGRYFIPGFYQNSLAQYIIAERKQNRLNTEFSIRHDTRLFDLYLWTNGQLQIINKNYGGFSGLIRQTYQLNKIHKIGYIVSSTWRPAAPNELYANGVHQGIASIEIGDAGMKRERSYNLSIEHIIEHKRFYLGYEIVAKYIDGFINLVPGKEPVLTIRGAFPSFYFTQQNAWIYGCIYNLRYNIDSNFSLRIRGNMLNGYNAGSKNYLNQMPPYDGRVEIQYERKSFQIKLFGDYTLKQSRHNDSSDYLPPPPSYFLLGLEINQSVKIKDFEMRWAISVSNALNATYRDYLNRFRYYTDAQGRNIQLRLNIPFTNYKKHQNEQNH